MLEDIAAELDAEALRLEAEATAGLREDPCDES
jgi:hypothetical protein